MAGTTSATRTDRDVELQEFEPPPRYKLLNGFPRTARFLAADPDKSTIIMRRFDETSVRNLLYLEGRVAALEALQKELDGDDYKAYSLNEAITRAASSWEYFALLGSSRDDIQKLSPKAIDTWISRRKNEMEIKVKEQEDLPPDLWSKDVKRAKEALEKLETFSKESSTERSDGHRRIELVDEKRLHLGYTPEDIGLVRERWEVAKALQSALKEYGEFLIP